MPCCQVMYRWRPVWSWYDRPHQWREVDLPGKVWRTDQGVWFASFPDGNCVGPALTAREARWLRRLSHR